ncbi:hypothetical protein NDU88_003046 [Pleurodeles waltl]|uniref:Uncharacterized protein n=1 Tax=Pleurodeles waltl TaxID=8319 RepID=A0AAV7KVF1_PLEWA|nr:hypothetical protein NDU88_003046 [Pleurodeles waltl]
MLRHWGPRTGRSPSVAPRDALDIRSQRLATPQGLGREGGGLGGSTSAQVRRWQNQTQPPAGITPPIRASVCCHNPGAPTPPPPRQILARPRASAWPTGRSPGGRNTASPPCRRRSATPGTAGDVPDPGCALVCAACHPSLPLRSDHGPPLPTRPRTCRPSSRDSQSPSTTLSRAPDEKWDLRPPHHSSSQAGPPAGGKLGTRTAWRLRVDDGGVRRTLRVRPPSQHP